MCVTVSVKPTHSCSRNEQGKIEKLITRGTYWPYRKFSVHICYHCCELNSIWKGWTHIPHTVGLTCILNEATPGCTVHHGEVTGSWLCGCKQLWAMHELMYCNYWLTSRGLKQHHGYMVPVPQHHKYRTAWDCVCRSWDASDCWTVGAGKHGLLLS